MTLENPPIIAINQARQGGFSSVNLPAPLNAPVITQPWGLGWLYVRNPKSGDDYDTRTVRGISGDGSTISAPFDVKTGGVNGGRSYWLLPVADDRFVVVFQWDIRTASPNAGNTGHIWIRTTSTNEARGAGRKGLLLSNTTASQIDITESLFEWLWLTGGADGFKPRSIYWSAPYSGNATPNMNGVQYAAEVYDAAWNAVNYDSSPRYIFDDNSFAVLANSGGFYDDTMPDGGGNWRMDLSDTSGFAEAKTQAPIVGAADKGSVWFKNYDDWDAKPYRLQRFIDDEWQQWSDGVSLVGSPAAVTPTWEWTNSFGNRFADAIMAPCISVPFTDRTEWFQTEFGMDVS